MGRIGGEYNEAGGGGSTDGPGGGKFSSRVKTRFAVRKGMVRGREKRELCRTSTPRAHLPWLGIYSPSFW